MTRLLIIDDEKDIRLSLMGLLEDEGYDVFSAESLEEAWPFILKDPPELVLLDVWLGKGVWDGLEALDRIKNAYPLLPVVMMSGHSTVSMAFHALKKGAQDFLEKPLEVKKLLTTIQRYLRVTEQQRLHHCYQKNSLEYWPPVLKDQQWKFLLHESPLVILGPHGSQQHLLAQAVHQKASRKHKPLGIIDGKTLNTIDLHKWFGFMKKNNPSSEPIDSKESSRVPGWLEYFHGGTVIVENIEYCNKKWQKYWIDFIAQPQHIPLGGQIPIVFDIQLIFCGTVVNNIDSKEKNLEIQETDKNIPFFCPQNPELSPVFYNTLISHGFFIHDLDIKDIESWGSFFLKHLESSKHLFPTLSNDSTQVEDKALQAIPYLASETLDILKQHCWKGDRQELYYTLALSNESWKRRGSIGPILPQDLPFQYYINPWMSSILEEPLKKARGLFEWHYMNHHCNRIQGNITQMAKTVGMNRAALHRKMRLLEDFLGEDLKKYSEKS